MSSNPKQIRILSVDDHPLLREGPANHVSVDLDLKRQGNLLSDSRTAPVGITLLYFSTTAWMNHRILDIEGGEVKFTWRDYRDNNQQKTMALSADQFIGRFLLHVLPSGFQRIRYYGSLANPHRNEKLEQCRQLLGMTARSDSSSIPVKPEDYRDRYERLTGRSLRECPVCHRGHMIPVANLPVVSSAPAIEDTS